MAWSFRETVHCPRAQSHAERASRSKRSTDRKVMDGAAATSESSNGRSWKSLKWQPKAFLSLSSTKQEFVGLAAIGGCIAQVIHIAWRRSWQGVTNGRRPRNLGYVKSATQNHFFCGGPDTFCVDDNNAPLLSERAPLVVSLLACILFTRSGESGGREDAHPSHLT